MNPSHQRISPFMSPPLSVLLFLLTWRPSKLTPHSSAQSSPLNPTFLLSSRHPIIMDKAAAAGFVRPESIPLLALTNESFYHRKLSWTLRFPVPPPDTSGSARRFSSTVTFRQGPHSAEALEGVLRLAASFSYNNDASHVLFNSPFLRLPDLFVLRPPRIDSLEDPSPLNMLYASGLITVHRVSSLPATANISLSLFLGWLTFSILTSTWYRLPL